MGFFVIKFVLDVLLMLRHFIIFALALFIVTGCKLSGNDPARVSFDDALQNSDLNLSLSPSSLSQTPHLTPSEPNIGSITSFESFDQGPLEDFNFSQAGNYRRMSLDQCITTALQNSPVIRELGGVILRAPEATATDSDPALAYADPRLGEQAALSAFDAAYNGQLLFQKNDGLFNNQFIGDEGAFQQDLAEYRSSVSKLAATGARYEFSHVINYELNNSPSNRFNGFNTTSFAYDTFFEAEVRQPLFQGAGTRFNRIAGPNNAPGVYNGVLIARTNTDIALADFEARVRDLISNVENAYWDLYFAYRDLEAKIEARNGAYDIWRNVEANKGEKSAAIIGQAKEQYYRFAAEVEDAIHGRLNDGTRTNNGSSSGTFTRTGGVRTGERRLRLITGMVLNDSQLVVPSEMPVEATSVFDWQESKNSAITRRPELRRQRWRIKARELELLASKNHLLPRVDLLATYRLRGFGRNLFGDGNELIQGAPFEQQVDSSAFGTLLNNDLQEWEVGVDVSVPIGFRNQHAAQRHAELSLSREVAILREQERQVIFGLSSAMGELARANRVRTANLNRLEAANEQFEAIQNIWREQDTTIDLVLEAQRRVIEAKLQYFQTQVEYMLAIKAIHFEEGTLFAYHNVALSESQAEQLAQEQHLRRVASTSRSISYWIPGLNTSSGSAPVNNQANQTGSNAGDIIGDSTELSQPSVIPTPFQPHSLLQPISVSKPGAAPTWNELSGSSSTSIAGDADHTLLQVNEALTAPAPSIPPVKNWSSPTTGGEHHSQPTIQPIQTSFPMINPVVPLGLNSDPHQSQNVADKPKPSSPVSMSLSDDTLTNQTTNRVASQFTKDDQAKTHTPTIPTVAVNSNVVFDPNAVVKATAEIASQPPVNSGSSNTGWANLKTDSSSANTASVSTPGVVQAKTKSQLPVVNRAIDSTSGPIVDPTMVPEFVPAKAPNAFRKSDLIVDPNLRASQPRPTVPAETSQAPPVPDKPSQALSPIVAPIK